MQRLHTVRPLGQGDKCRALPLRCQSFSTRRTLSLHSQHSLRYSVIPPLLPYSSLSSSSLPAQQSFPPSKSRPLSSSPFPSSSSFSSSRSFSTFEDLTAEIRRTLSKARRRKNLRYNVTLARLNGRLALWLEQGKYQDILAEWQALHKAHQARQAEHLEISSPQMQALWQPSLLADVKTCNIVLKALSQQATITRNRSGAAAAEKNIQRAESLLEEMESMGLQPDRDTARNLADLHCSLGQHEQGLEAILYMKERYGVRPRESTFEPLFGRIDHKAAFLDKVLQAMKEEGLDTLKALHSNPMRIIRLVNNGHLDKALLHWDEMERHRRAKDLPIRSPVVYRGLCHVLIEKCASGAAQRRVQLFEAMTMDAGIKPLYSTMAIMVKTYCKLGQREKAEHLFEEMLREREEMRRLTGAQFQGEQEQQGEDEANDSDHVEQQLRQDVRENEEHIPKDVLAKEWNIDEEDSDDDDDDDDDDDEEDLGVTAGEESKEDDEDEYEKQAQQDFLLAEAESQQLADLQNSLQKVELCTMQALMALILSVSERQHMKDILPLIERAQAGGVTWDLYVITSLIRALSSVGHFDLASKFLEQQFQLQLQQRQKDPSCSFDEVPYIALISGCRKSKSPLKALEVWSKLKQHIAAFEKAAQPQGQSQAQNQAPAPQKPRNLYDGSGVTHQDEAGYQQYVPSPNLLDGLLRACWDAREYKRGLALWKELNERYSCAENLDEPLLRILLLLNSKAAQAEQAYALFQTARERSIPPELSLFAPLLYVLAQQPEPLQHSSSSSSSPSTTSHLWLNRLFEVLQYMTDYGRVPDASVMNVAVGELCKKGDVSGALSLLRYMLKHFQGMQANASTCEALARALIRAGELDKAFGVLDLVREWGVSLQPAGYTALLSLLCRFHPPSTSRKSETKIRAKALGMLARHLLSDKNLRGDLFLFQRLLLALVDVRCKEEAFLVWRRAKQLGYNLSSSDPQVCTDLLRVWEQAATNPRTTTTKREDEEDEEEEEEEDERLDKEQVIHELTEELRQTMESRQQGKIMTPSSFLPAASVETFSSEAIMGRKKRAGTTAAAAPPSPKSERKGALQSLIDAVEKGRKKRLL
ncbi:hypothetical protein QOT17_005559 [Balamuthia mandrillaris]